MSEAGRHPRITPEDILEVFAQRNDWGEPLTAPELADSLDCSRRTALNKLHSLEKNGEVTSKKVGGRSKVWWIPNAGEGSDNEVSPDATNRDGTTLDTAPNTSTDPTHSSEADRDVVSLVGPLLDD